MRVEDFEVAEFEFVGFELGIDKVMLNTIAYCIFCMYFFWLRLKIIYSKQILTDFDFNSENLFSLISPYMFHTKVQVNLIT